MSFGMSEATKLIGEQAWTSDGISPDRTAFVLDGEAITFGQFDSDVDAAVTLMRRAGVGPGKTIAIHFGGLVHDRPYEEWVAHLAAMRLGAVHATIVDQTGMDLVAGRIDAVVGTPLETSPVPVVVITRAALAAVSDGEALDLSTAPDPARGARLNLTSGTTGSAKLVRWDAAMIAARVAQAGEAEFINADARLYTVFSPRVTAGFRYPLAVWAAGGCVLIQIKPGKTPIAPAAVDDSTLFVCSPLQLERGLVLKKTTWPGRDSRVILCVGGRVPAAVRDRALAIAGSQVLIGYGSTETGNIATGDARLVDRHPGAIGRVRDGVTVEVVDASGKSLPSGTVGRIRVKSPIMVKGYDNAGGEAERVGLIDGWFYPGDLGLLLDDGVLAIEGRDGDIVNLGGVKVAMPAIEEKVRALPDIADACACVLHTSSGDRLVFAVVCDDATFATIGERVGAALGPVNYPFNVTRLARIPRNAMGKVPRLQLARQLAQQLTKA